MTEFEESILNWQIAVTHIHEAGHVIAARSCQINVVSADILLHGKQCGLTKIEPISADYSRSTGLPIDKRDAFKKFTYHNIQVLAGPAAQAIYCFENKIKTSQGFASIQPEIMGLLLEFSKDELFYVFDEDKLTHGMGFVLNETGAGGDWQTILNNFKNLPYDHFAALNTHPKRIKYLQTLWMDILELLRESWEDLLKVAAALENRKILTGAEIDIILS